MFHKNRYFPTSAIALSTSTGALFAVAFIVFRTI